MFRLVHLSDPHIGPLPAPTFSELASKRMLGYVNWHRNRATSMRGDILVRMIAEIHALAPDHVAVTGDLVNIALRSELEPARAFLDSIGSPKDVSVVPGNHDAYVPGALARATHLIAEAHANITEVHHQRAFTLLPAQNVEVEFVLQTRGPEHIEQVIATLDAAGFKAENHDH